MLKKKPVHTLCIPRWELLKKKPYAPHVRLGRVDCTAEDSSATCQKHHIHAFPTIRVYRRRMVRGPLKS